MLAGYRAGYEQIIALGHPQNPPPTLRTAKRGPIGRSPAANMLRRLDEQREQVLRFAHDFQVPFDNNLVERDIRMIKIQQKISGSWRTTTGADRFLALRAYISTTRKQGRDTLDAPLRGGSLSIRSSTYGCRKKFDAGHDVTTGRPAGHHATHVRRTRPCARRFRRSSRATRATRQPANPDVEVTMAIPMSAAR